MDQLSQVAASFGMFLPGLLDSVNCVCSCVCVLLCAFVCGWRGELDNGRSDWPPLRPNGPQLSAVGELN